MAFEAFAGSLRDALADFSARPLVFVAGLVVPLVVVSIPAGAVFAVVAIVNALAFARFPEFTIAVFLAGVVAELAIAGLGLAAFMRFVFLARQGGSLVGLLIDSFEWASGRWLDFFVHLGVLADAAVVLPFILSRLFPEFFTGLAAASAGLVLGVAVHFVSFFAVPFMVEREKGVTAAWEESSAAAFARVPDVALSMVVSLAVVALAVVPPAGLVLVAALPFLGLAWLRLFERSEH
jgi:hypothetical protein